MQFSSKIGWSAAGGMTVVAAVLAGLLWGRSHTTPTATAQPFQPWLEQLALPKADDADFDNPAVRAEIEEAKSRLKINLFSNSCWQSDEAAAEEFKPWWPGTIETLPICGCSNCDSGTNGCICLEPALGLAPWDAAHWGETMKGEPQSNAILPAFAQILAQLPAYEQCDSATRPLIQMITPRIIIVEEEEDKLLGNATAP